VGRADAQRRVERLGGELHLGDVALEQLELPRHAVIERARARLGQEVRIRVHADRGTPEALDQAHQHLGLAAPHVDDARPRRQVEQREHAVDLLGADGVEDGVIAVGDGGELRLAQALDARLRRH